MADEGVGTANEVGDIDSIKSRVLFDDLSRSQYSLSITPIHLPDLFRRSNRFQRKEVHGNSKNSQVLKFPRNLKIDSGVAGIVRTADDHHDFLFLSNRIEDLLY